MSSHITFDERVAILADPQFAVGPPILIGGITRTQFSIARHYGGVSFNGHQYTYMAETDELIRDDLLKWITKQRKAEAKAAKVCGSQKSDRETQRNLWMADETKKDLFR